MENQDKNDGILILANQNDKIVICAGNPVCTERKDYLNMRFEMIDGLSKRGLERYYEKKLMLGSEENDSDLSLVSLARKSTTRIKHQFVPMQDGRYFYNLHVTL